MAFTGALTTALFGKKVDAPDKLVVEVMRRVLDAHSERDGVATVKLSAEELVALRAYVDGAK